MCASPFRKALVINNCPKKPKKPKLIKRIRFSPEGVFQEKKLPIPPTTVASNIK